MSAKDFGNLPIVRMPKKDDGKLLRKLRIIIEEKYKLKFDSFWDFHRWTIENVPQFWGEFWHFAEIIYSKPYEQVVDMSVSMSDSPKWFSGARVNFAENLLKFRDDHTAIISAGEDKATEYTSYKQLYEEACVYGSALRRLGVQKGDRVVCYMSNRKEPVIAMLGTISIGAIWSGALPLLGAQAVINRFNQIGPKILFTIDRFVHGGEEKDMLSRVVDIVKEIPSLEKVIIVPSKEESKKKDISNIKNSCFLDEFLALGRNEDGSVDPLVFEQLPVSHPLFISYTSGTTGTPKAMVHGFGLLLNVCRDLWLHMDGSRDDSWLSVSPVGWATWIVFTAVQFVGMTVVLFEGAPHFLSPTYLWDMIDRLGISHILLMPSVLDEMEQRGYGPTEDHHLKSLKVIMSGGSVVKHQNFDFVYEKIKNDVLFANAYGCTEVMGSAMTIETTLPVYKGEIQTASFGVDLQCYDDDGNVLTGEVGEVVIRTNGPGFPLALWGDKDGSLFKTTYFSKYQDVLRVGDMCLINPVTRGFTLHGRSDDTLKQRGCRFGSSEIYNIVGKFPEVSDSVCVSQYSEQRDERAVLFLKMTSGQHFSQELVQRLRKEIKQELSARHVPEVMLQTQDIPHNLNGKKTETIVKKIINRMPYTTESVVNPDSLQNFIKRPELQGF